eukprot:7767821-Pyramimonas_sp.AAC.1
MHRKLPSGNLAEPQETILQPGYEAAARIMFNAIARCVRTTETTGTLLLEPPGRAPTVPLSSKYGGRDTRRHELA